MACTIASCKLSEYVDTIPEWRLVTCKRCKVAVWPKEIKSHFRGMKHVDPRIPARIVSDIGNHVRSWPDLIQDGSELVVPWSIEEPIQQLALFKSGLLCQADPENCHYICLQKLTMKAHIKHTHGVASKYPRGRVSEEVREQREADVVLWKEVPAVQRFFGSGTRTHASRFFQVLRPDLYTSEVWKFKGRTPVKDNDKLGLQISMSAIDSADEDGLDGDRKAPEKADEEEERISHHKIFSAAISQGPGLIVSEHGQRENTEQLVAAEMIRRHGIDARHPAIQLLELLERAEVCLEGPIVAQDGFDVMDHQPEAATCEALPADIRIAAAEQRAKSAESRLHAAEYLVQVKASVEANIHCHLLEAETRVKMAEARARAAERRAIAAEDLVNATRASVDANIEVKVLEAQTQLRMAEARAAAAEHRAVVAEALIERMRQGWKSV